MKHPPLFGLHVLVDDDPRWGRDPVAQAKQACAGGARILQLRCKHASDAQILEWGRAIRELTHSAGAALVLNDRLDLALLCEADALHLGQEDIPPSRIPSDLRARLQIGLSAHTLDQVRAGKDEPVDYIAFGPVFGTRSKDSPYDRRGLELLSEAARAAQPHPLIAIGGIDTANLGAVREAGAAGFAVIGAIAGAPDPGAATRSLIDTWERFPSR